MNKELDIIKEQISSGEVEQAIAGIDSMLLTECPKRDVAFYLRGNAYRKLGNWQEALNSYQQAIDLNPESPAQQARQAVMDILNFYHKDMYNQ